MIITNKDIKTGRFKSDIKKKLKKFEGTEIHERIFKKDFTVWKKDEQYGELIRNRLGWLVLPLSMADKTEEINSFVSEIRESGFEYAVVMGMGGSSMCPEVCRETFGVRKGFPDLFVLDSTDPETISDIEDSIDITKTLFIVSSKSGTTIEVDSFLRYFYAKAEEIFDQQAGSRFVSITDPGTYLETLSKELGFRKVFVNPPDIGGRYSALSYFGLVPAALIGVDIARLLKNAEAVMNSCIDEPLEKNYALLAGLTAGSLSEFGVDKLTFFLSEKIRSFGYWVEQLIAESTGKEEKGILPVEGEIAGKSSSYGRDRFFVNVYLKKDKNRKRIKALMKKKFPVMNIELKELYDIGGLFYFWEFATAVMGAYLNINPFDEPNVKESKDNTSKVLSYYNENKKFPDQMSISSNDKIKLYPGKESDAGNLLSMKNGKVKISDLLKYFMDQFTVGDYISIMAYLNRTEKTEKLLQELRELLRTSVKCATTLGYGPRFLHSTGQFHKGGPDRGMFIQIVCDDKSEKDIPGKEYGFSILKQAQAIGDFESLQKHGRRILKINTGSDANKGLKELIKAFRKVLK
ncbi:MAG: glucose-6-phosphate isomerase [Bacteroidetes bacterium]|nr:glucose-6-phosphate isomerase [Bacteroidota bacterium]